ncbi:MAG: phosphoglucosamine mutase [Chitinophagales bacterium]|nr:phosphoglucosamine mutase [Chitinophagales bacterium]
MTLIKSISGIRGTIGGKADQGLTPIDIVKFTSAYAQWIKNNGKNKKIVIGRDARISGEMVNKLVVGSLMGMGMDVVDLELSTTPTVEMAVVNEKAAGGIVLTASHNPKQWNALKLLNQNGEFISSESGAEIIAMVESDDFTFTEVGGLGSYKKSLSYIDWHIEQIVDMPLVDLHAIKKKDFKIVVDAVNSTGGIAVPKLLRGLGVEKITELNCEPTGEFAHNPEPLPENLTGLSNEVNKIDADLGIVVDPDVDRLAMVCEDGSPFGEEYTLVAIADYVLSINKGNTVSNLSSTRALKDITENLECEYHASAVGEVNVVKKMKEVSAVIGGEGNGGVIYPKLHYGRDALAGIALFLSHLARSGKTASMLRSKYPNYHISKNKIQLEPEMNVDSILDNVQTKYKNQPISTIDGVKIEFENDWVLLRKSNTEPIIRIYSESTSETTADNIAKQIIADLKYFAKNGN